MEQVTAKATRSGSRTNCSTAPKPAGVEAQPSFATFPSRQSHPQSPWGFSLSQALQDLALWGARAWIVILVKLGLTKSQPSLGRRLQTIDQHPLHHFSVQYLAAPWNSWQVAAASRSSQLVAISGCRLCIPVVLIRTKLLRIKSNLHAESIFQPFDCFWKYLYFLIMHILSQSLWLNPDKVQRSLKYMWKGLFWTGKER